MTDNEELLKGWRGYEGDELKFGQVLMINETDLAYVHNTYFKGINWDYDFSATGAKIDDDGTFYDQTDNSIVLGKITAIMNVGFLNEK